MYVYLKKKDFGKFFWSYLMFTYSFWECERGILVVYWMHNFWSVKVIWWLIVNFFRLLKMFSVCSIYLAEAMFLIAFLNFLFFSRLFSFLTPVTPYVSVRLLKNDKSLVFLGKVYLTAARAWAPFAVMFFWCDI